MLLVDTNVLPAVSDYPVLTRDVRRYASYFPSVSLITLGKSA